MIAKNMFCSFQSQLRSMFSNKEIPFNLWMSHTNTKLKCIIVCTKTCKDTIFLATQVLISCFPIKCSIWMDAFLWLCYSCTSISIWAKTLNPGVYLLKKKLQFLGSTIEIPLLMQGIIKSAPFCKEKQIITNSVQTEHIIFII